MSRMSKKRVHPRGKFTTCLVPIRLRASDWERAIMEVEKSWNGLYH